MTDRKDTPDLFAACKAQDATLPAESGASASTGFGQRLGAARAARGLSLADCGRELHLPVKVLQRLESNNFGAPDDFVFLCGALKGYAAFLGLPPGSCDGVLRAAAPSSQPALVSVARTSRSRWLLQRYGTAATYIVLTATIAVPLVVLGLRGGLQRPVARIVSLDQPAAPTQAVPVPPPSHRVAITSPPDLAPFRASMTPFAAIGLGEDGQPETGANVTETATPPADAAPAQHTLTMTASADCWFEITGADGNKIASGMLRAGDTRTWHSSGLLRVTLGNAGAVTVTRDGQSFPLDDVQRANVAHFDVFGPPGAGENG
ncbi:MAG: helix-turn-helix domain-containing protein [Rhodanobacteraceae bacterium]